MGSRKFTFAKAEKAPESNNSRMVAVVLSHLKRLGWLNVDADSVNARKKVYQFTHLEIMKEMAKINVT